MKGLFIARQPGTIQAFEALIAGLEKKNVLQTAELVVLDTESILTPSIAEASFDFVLTGTSLDVVGDSKIWSWAQSKNIPVYAYHDQWVNTAERFHGAATLPEAVLVVDEAAQKMVDQLKLNIPVVVIGSPLWGFLFAHRDSMQKDLAVFATEPASLESFKTVHGFDDLDSLSMALEACERSGKSWQFEILLHPIDRRERIENYLKAQPQRSQVQVRISSRNKQQVFDQAQFLFGMRSMLLVEASIAGVPVVSFQPQRKTASPATDRPGIEVMTEMSQAKEAFAMALKNKAHQPKALAEDLFAKFLQARLKHL